MNPPYQHSVRVQHDHMFEVNNWLCSELTRRGIPLNDKPPHTDPKGTAYHVHARSHWDGINFSGFWTYTFRDPDLAMMFKLAWGGK